MKAGKSFGIYWGDEKIGEVTEIELTINDISWDETWLVAYMARMYANEYRN